VDSLHAELTARGAKVVKPPQDYDYGMRDFDVLDPDGNQLIFGMESRQRVDVRFGSLAHILQRNRHVRFTPKSEHFAVHSPCPLCANSGHLHHQKWGSHSPAPGRERK
jgi:hypothetical protein